MEVHVTIRVGLGCARPSGAHAAAEHWPRATKATPMRLASGTRAERLHRTPEGAQHHVAIAAALSGTGISRAAAKVCDGVCPDPAPLAGPLSHPKWPKSVGVFHT